MLTRRSRSKQRDSYHSNLVESEKDQHDATDAHKPESIRRDDFCRRDTSDPAAPNAMPIRMNTSENPATYASALTIIAGRRFEGHSVGRPGKMSEKERNQAGAHRVM